MALFSEEDMVHSYTREEAIKDGALVDITWLNDISKTLDADNICVTDFLHNHLKSYNLISWSTTSAIHRMMHQFKREVSEQISKGIPVDGLFRFDLEYFEKIENSVYKKTMPVYASASDELNGKRCLTFMTKEDI